MIMENDSLETIPFHIFYVIEKFWCDELGFVLYSSVPSIPQCFTFPTLSHPIPLN